MAWELRLTATMTLGIEPETSKWPRVQIYTVEDYFAGHQPALPLVA